MAKIVVYVNSLAKGGAERVAVNLANYFHESGFEVVLVTSRVFEDEYEEPEGVRRIISEVEHGEITNRVAYFWGRFRRIRKIWKKERPDMIVSFIGKVNMMALMTTFGMGIPVVVSVRSDPNREYSSKLMRFLSKTLFLKAKGIIVQTSDAKKYFPGYMQKKVTILPNSLNPKFLKPRFEGERRNEIVSVGRMDANKNHQMLVHAFGKIAGDFPDMQLILYGDGLPESSTRQELEGLVQDLKLQDRVLFMGRRNDVDQRIYESRIFVLTSNVEGMPNALLEAMSLGLACISTDCPCGGPRTVIQDGENGLLIPVGDTAALERALRLILNDPDLEERLGVNAFAIQNDLAPERVNQMWMDYIMHYMKV
ncbi:MAG: glycosyltransferase [Lachnospiraceae bacterium]|nr:glycosyltransferase [Lachnospiraceae bacterium]